MKNRRAASILRQKRGMNHNHSLFKLADNELGDHVSEGADDSEIRLIDLLGKKVPFRLDLWFIAFGFDRSRIRNGFLHAEDLYLIFELLFRRGIMGDDVQVRVGLMEFDCWGIGDPAGAEEYDALLSENTQIVFTKIREHLILILPNYPQKLYNQSQKKISYGTRFFIFLFDNHRSEFLRTFFWVPYTAIIINKYRNKFDL